ncbi:MAG: cytochrome C, partial [Gammaproteobacteria bacterium]|nr:cytochrome C [Gammaproteobacteria bacterium]
TATGKGNNHLPTGNTCESCHTTTAWTPARFDHAGVSPGTCSSCHNGVRATGKTLNHIVTTAECDVCHSTLAWTPARFSHTGITTGCNACHDGVRATGKDNGHMTTSRECVICHSTTAWTPLTFRHTSADYPGDHRGSLACLACHTTNTDQATWKSAAYKPACAGCHASSFKPSAHKKYTSPTTVFYTVAELKNCSGACHVYKDSTLTTITTRRNGPEHRVTDASFD